MYAYYTLAVITLLYIIFAIFSLRHGRWYYLLVHPFALFCFELVLKYRYASDIPGLAVPVDRMIAVGIVLASLMFGIGYILVKEEWVDYLKSFFFCKQQNETVGIPTQKFRICIICIILGMISYFVCQYVRYGEFKYLFFSAYQGGRSIEATSSFWVLGIHSIMRSLFMSFPFISIILLFEILDKRKSHQYVTIFLIFFITIIARFGLYSFGGRFYIQICFISCLILLISQFLCRQIRLRKIAIPILILIFVFDCLFFLTLREIRRNGLQTLPTAIINLQKNFHNKLKENLFIESSISKNTGNTPKIEILKIPNKELIQSDAKQISDTKQIITDQKQYGQELQYIKSRPRYGHQVSREIAWIVAYFGRYAPYAGITSEARFAINIFFPPPLGKDRSYNGPSNILQKLGRGNAEGPFGNGYVSYGIIGGYLYWMVYAFICGLLAKFAVIDIFRSKKNYLECTAFSLCMITIISTVLCSTVIPLCLFMQSFIMVWFINWLLKLSLQRKIIVQN